MARRLTWSAAALALAVLTGSVSPALAADERTDLSIELRPFNPTRPRQVVLRVANATAWWANTADLTVKTSQAKQGTLSRSHFDDFDPGWTGEVTYTLAADCKPGDTITASLSIAVNYAGVKESNPNNNVITAKEICPAASPAAPKPQADPKPQAPAAKPQTDPKPQADPKPQPDPKLQAAPAPKPLPDLKSRSVLRPEDLPVPAPPLTVPDNAIDLGTPALNPAGAPSQRSAGVQALEGVIPVHTRPGRHTLEFQPSLVRSLSTGGLLNLREDTFSVSTSDLDASNLLVGWYQFPGIEFSVAETALNFNLNKLLEVQQPVVESAQLNFVEHELNWSGSTEWRRENPGCVAELGMATNDWAGPLSSFVSQPNNLFRYKRLTSKLVPHTRTAEENSGGFRQRAFVVTDHVKHQLLNPNDVALWFGYVLYGQLDDPKHAPEGACTSRITDLTLSITYVVPAN
jgi:hypothetical protein